MPVPTGVFTRLSIIVLASGEADNIPPFGAALTAEVLVSSNYFDTLYPIFLGGRGDFLQPIRADARPTGEWLVFVAALFLDRRICID